MLSGGEACELVKSGTETAAKMYEKWACGSWLSDAGVESVIQTEIARSLFDSDKCYVTLETSMKHAKEWDEAFDENSSFKAFNKSRFDICIWSKGHKLTGIVEVKRSKEVWQFEKDMSRMKDMLSISQGEPNINLRYTMVAFYLWASSEKKLNKVVNNVEECFGEIAGEDLNSYFESYPIIPLEGTQSKQCVAIAYFA